MKSWIKSNKMVVLLAGLLIFSLVISGCSSKSEQAVANSDPQKQGGDEQKTAETNQHKLVVEVAEVSKDDFEVKLDFTGELTGYRKVDLVPETSGVVKEIKFEEGERIQEGQMMLKLDQAIEKAKVEKAEGNLEVAKARLDKLKAGSRIEKIKQAEASLKQAEANLNNAQKNFNRVKKMYKKNVISESEYDSTKRKYEVAKAKMETAKHQLQLVKKGPRQEEIKVARAQVKQAKAALNSAQTRLNKTTIESPIKGFITQKMIELGEMASTGKPVAKIVQLRPLEVEGSIATTDLTKVAVSQQVTIEVNGYPKRVFTGKVSRVASTIDPSNRGLKVTVRLANKKLLLKPGMFAVGKILVDELKNILVVPKAAIRKQNGSEQILVVKNGVIKSRDVETGSANKNRIIIREGLKPGEQVVVRGPANLQPGTEVKAIEWRETE